MSGVDDMSLDPTVGPPSSLVALFSFKIKEGTAKLFHLPWWYWETLRFHLQETVLVETMFQCIIVTLQTLGQYMDA